MYRNIDSGKIKDCRQDCLHSYRRVRHAHILCHQECGSAHNRRHNLAARRGGRLNGACKLGLIAASLHHRNCNGTGCYGVANGRTGYHAAERRRDNGNLGRTSGRGAAEAVGQINKETRYSGPFQKSSKNNKHHNIFGADIDRSIHYSACRIEQIINHLAETDGGKGVHQQSTDNAQNGNTNTAAAQFHQSHHGNDRDHHHHRISGNAGCQLDNLLCMQSKIEKRSRTCHHNNYIIPWHIVDPGNPLFDRIIQVAQNQNHSEESGQTNLRKCSAEQCYINAVDGETHRQPSDD